jgi:hypothetical protein
VVRDSTRFPGVIGGVKGPGVGGDIWREGQPGDPGNIAVGWVLVDDHEGQDTVRAVVGVSGQGCRAAAG